MVITITGMPQPVVATVNDVASDAGLALMLASDLTIAVGKRRGWCRAPWLWVWCCCFSD
ncbi:hypothetical protein DFAR_3690023 [Desulfarculales bacterium]